MWCPLVKYTVSIVVMLMSSRRCHRCAIRICACVLGSPNRPRTGRRDTQYHRTGRYTSRPLLLVVWAGRWYAMHRSHTDLTNPAARADVEAGQRLPEVIRAQQLNYFLALGAVRATRFYDHVHHVAVLQGIGL